MGNADVSDRSKAAAVDWTIVASGYATVNSRLVASDSIGKEFTHDRITENGHRYGRLTGNRRRPRSGTVAVLHGVPLTEQGAGDALRKRTSVPDNE